MVDINDNMPEYGDPDTATTIVNGYDIQNLPGATKIRLIKQGHLSIDNFMTPPNMPGKKLAELRKAHRERVEEQMAVLDASKGGIDNPYSVGDIVEYKGSSYEVLEIKDLKIKIYSEEKGKNVFVPAVMVTKG